jgi:hypothetical protein
MALILEDGSGVVGANSLILPATVNDYLVERNRAAENGWAAVPTVAEEAACIAATSHFEIVFGPRLKGLPLYAELTSRAKLDLTASPADADTFELGGVTYTFVSSTPDAEGEVEIGSSVFATMGNLVQAINGGAGGGTPNEAACARLLDADTILLFSRTSGPGDVSGAVGGAWGALAPASLTGGTFPPTPQALSYPRAGVDGFTDGEIPRILEHALAEYAARARAGDPLAPDPTVDPSGGSVTSLRERVGPLETATEYVPGTYGTGTIPPIPAADRLLAPLVEGSVSSGASKTGRVRRG